MHIHLPVVLTQLISTNSAASSFQAYLAWGEFPVITTVSTTALPIEELPWPSFTICNQVLVMVIVVVVVMVMILVMVAMTVLKTIGAQGRGAGATERVYEQQFHRWYYFCIISTFALLFSPINSFLKTLIKVPGFQGEGCQYAPSQGGEGGGEEVFERLLPWPDG